MRLHAFTILASVVVLSGAGECNAVPPVSQVEVVNEPLAVTGAVEITNEPLAVDVTNEPLAVEVMSAPPLGPPARFQLVGFTSTTHTGDEGVLRFTLACQAEFAGSRMCSSQEVLDTTDVPSGLGGYAWVRTTFQPTGSLKLDASGFYDAIGSPTEGLTCEGCG